MSFSWNAWSWVNVMIDGGILLTAFFATAFFSRRLHPALAVFLALSFATISWVVIGAFSPFGVFFIARVLWTVGSVLLPVSLLWLSKKRRRPGLIFLASFLIGFKFYGEVWEPSRLQVSRIHITSHKVSRPIRITHLSDLQTDGISKTLRRARQASNDFDPHLLLFTGDVLNHPSLIPSVRDYFAGFTHQAGAFGVGGNVDGLLDLPRFAESAGWGFIEASARTLRVEGSSVSVIGLGISDTSNSTLLRDSLANLNTADFKILLAHYPDALFIAHDKGIDLQLSGHTHGGQVCTPWGPVVTFSRVPKSIAAGGLHRVGDMFVLVSRGLGWEGHVAPRVRTFCRPQIALIEISPAHPGDAPGPPTG